MALFLELWRFLCFLPDKVANTRAGPPEPFLSFNGAMLTLKSRGGKFCKFVSWTTEKRFLWAINNLTFPF